MVGIYADEGITGTKTNKREKLLFILDNKLNKYHARYGNILLTYNEIHITSVWTPKDFLYQVFIGNLICRPSHLRSKFCMARVH